MRKDRDSLLRLRESLRQATGPSRDLDHRLFEHIAPVGPFRRYTSSLDSSIALVEEALPGWGWDVGSPVQPSGGQPWASVWPWGLSERRAENHRNGATPVLALLDALVCAVLDQLPPALNLSAEIEYALIEPPTTDEPS